MNIQNHTSARITIWLIPMGIVIPYVGLVVDWFFPATLAYSRAGSLMVVCALICFFINQFVKNDSEVTNELKAALDKLPQEALDRLSELMQRVSPEARITLENSNLHSLYKERGSLDSQVEAMSANSRLLLYSEFVLGVLGTLIWGFGDLKWFQILTLPVLLFVAPYFFFRVYQASR